MKNEREYTEEIREVIKEFLAIIRRFPLSHDFKMEAVSAILTLIAKQEQALRGSTDLEKKRAEKRFTELRDGMLDIFRRYEEEATAIILNSQEKEE